MTNETRKNRDEFRVLNLKIRSHQRTIKINSAAGQVFTQEYLDWVNQLIERSIYLSIHGGF
jgi:hypothetical protein